MTYVDLHLRSSSLSLIQRTLRIPFASNLRVTHLYALLRRELRKHEQLASTDAFFLMVDETRLKGDTTLGSLMDVHGTRATDKSPAALVIYVEKENAFG
jgi:hypothetical protein